jgi:hypothetical protein
MIFIFIFIEKKKKKKLLDINLCTNGVQVQQTLDYVISVNKENMKGRWKGVTPSVRPAIPAPSRGVTWQTCLSPLDSQCIPLL